MSASARPAVARRSGLGGGPRTGALLGVATAALAGLAARHARAARRAERSHPPIGRFLDVDGVRLHYAEWGEGPPVVLLHGNGTIAQDWAISGLAAKLSRRHRVIALDRPGYGHSSRPRGRAWTPKAQAGLIAEASVQLKADRPILVGHSWGAIVALALGLDHPDSVRGLVLLGGYYFPTQRLDVWASTPPAVPVVGDVMRYAIGPSVTRLIAKGIVRRSFAPRPVPKRFKARFPLDLALRPWQIRASAEESALMIPAVAEMRRRYKDLRPPVAILAGAQDQVAIPSRHAVRLHRAIPHSTLKLSPNVGHMMHYDAHRDILEAVESVAERAG
jgi:pimeloyl-ACP methyl ester carboxylesterase